jgi:hypothetical protein
LTSARRVCYPARVPGSEPSAQPAPPAAETSEPAFATPVVDAPVPAPAAPGAQAPGPTSASPAAEAPGTAAAPRHLARELGEALRGIHAPGAIACLVAAAAMVLSHHQGDSAFFRVHFGSRFTSSPLAEVYPYLYWFGASVALYLLLPLAAARLTPGLRVRDTGLGLGDWRAGLVAAGAAFALFAPVVFAAARLPEFANHYPLCSAARRSLGAFLLYEAAYAAYFVAWEYLFRGYLLFSLEPSMGKLAVFAQMMPFAVLHFGKPEAETFGSIAAGVLLGLLALRTRSFWYGALLHIAVAWSMDVFAAWGALRP